MLRFITVKKAAQHNLKKIDLSLPRNSMIVVTGPSGSGKSSLAFDTLFAEGQRRYIECMSAYARQYIEQMEKPDVESIHGISPSISIDQKTISLNPRSTVGTITETYDFLRLLFAKVGIPHCSQCGRKVESQTQQQIYDRMARVSSGENIRILAPVVKGRKGEHHRLLERYRKKGFLRARIDGKFEELDQEIILERTKPHNIEILIDTVTLKPSEGKRIKEAVEKALEMGKGDLLVLEKDDQETRFSLSLLCPYCGISLPELEPRSFSFNSPYGACLECHGVGLKTVVNHWGEPEVTDETCPHCEGGRLRKESLAVEVGGKNIFEWSSLPISLLYKEMTGMIFPASIEKIALPIRKEIMSRLKIMGELGMSYLQLTRKASSLSGGEARRVRLAAQMGSRLRGILYVLDEPTIGLHQKDNHMLISLLKEIRDDGNSVVVVEHDEQTIRAADFVLDLGPGAGEGGGYKVTEGELKKIIESPVSLTAKYLTGEKQITVPQTRRGNEGWLTVLGAAEHNLKDIDVRIPLGAMTVVSGVSGSGKSTLVYDIVFKSLSNIFYKSKSKAGRHKEILGVEKIDKVISVDQKPIGRTPRSNPSTYTSLFTSLRQLFAMAQESRIRGYAAGRFSFNIKGGRCEECQGAGLRKIEMHFLPDVFVTCDRCSGKRYNKETLAVLYKGKNIADFLDMTVDEAYEILKAHPPLKRKLGVLKKVGLGYIRLGQPAPTLSGGEAQRIKLAKELSRKNTGRTLYLLDEPTTGLHFDDVRKLLEVLAELVDLGNTMVIIEHNMEVLKVSDHIIDLGPDGGEKGGWIVAEGTPEEVAGKGHSYTGKYLKKALASSKMTQSENTS